MTRLGRFYESLVEMGWLVAIAATPLYFNIYSSRVFEPDKATLLRTVVVLTAAAYLLQVLERRFGPSGQSPSSAPSGPLVVPAMALALIQILATATSIAPSISLWGSYMRLQGTYTFLSYFTLFLIMMASLRRREQVDRLINVALMASLPVCLYGIVQAMRLDPLPWGGDVTTRVTSSMGNAIFLAAYIIMVVPLTLTRLVDAVRRHRAEGPTTPEGWKAVLPGLSQQASLVVLANLLPALLLAVNLQNNNLWWLAIPAVVLLVLCTLPLSQMAGGTRRIPAVAGIATYGLLLAVQMAAIVFTQSRGPWIGLAAGLVCFVALVAVRGQHRRLLRAAAAVAIPAALLLIVFNMDIPQLAPLKQVPYVGRLGSLTEIDSGTGKVRWLIWQGSLELIRQRPDPGLKPDALSWVRPIVGYGPDAIALAENKVYQPGLGHLEARNASPDRNHLNLLDHLLMTGVLGLVAYIVLVVAGLGLGWQQMWRAQGGYEQLVIIGLVSGLVAHLVESQVGIVIVVTWTYFWVYLAVLARAPLWAAASPPAEPVPVMAEVSAIGAAPVAGSRPRRAHRPQTEKAPAPSLRHMPADGAGSGWWLAAYSGVCLLGAVLLLAVAAVENARLALLLSFLVAACGMLAGAAFISGRFAYHQGRACFAGGELAVARANGSAAGRARKLPSWSGHWISGVAPAVAIVGVILVASWNMDVVSADIYYKRAVGAEQAGRFDTSIHYYQTAIRLQPSQDWYYIFLGRNFLTMSEKKRPTDGGVPLNQQNALQVVNMDPRSFASMSKEALLRAAALAFERGRDLNPLNPDHYANLGRMHRYWGESTDRRHYEDSVRYLQQAITISPRTAHLRNELARTYLVMNDADMAIQTLETSIAIDPDYAYTHTLLAATYQVQGRWDDAIAAYARAMELDPASMAEAGNEQRLIAYIENGKTEELVAACQKMVEKHPNHPASYSTYGFVLSRLGRVAEALQAFKRNAKLTPKDWIVHKNLAVSYQQLGMIPEAIAAAETAIQLAPEGQRRPLQEFVAGLQSARRQ